MCIKLQLNFHQPTCHLKPSVFDNMLLGQTRYGASFISLSATRFIVLIRQCAHAAELLRSGVDMSGGHENFTAVVGDQLEQFKC